jgi:hypothetical protein
MILGVEQQQEEEEEVVEVEEVVMRPKRVPSNPKTRSSRREWKPRI